MKYRHFTMSMGAGVQTTAMLIKYNTDFEQVIFADTGDEIPQTYEYIEKYLKPFCKEHDIPWYTVKKRGYDSLMDYCFQKKTLPIKLTRWCTREFKIFPVNRKLKELGARKNDPFDIAIGISIDESHRLGSGAFVDKPMYQHKVYPFIEDKISRKDCYKIIQDYGWELPMKSGCDYCPFKPKKELQAIRVSNPERFKQIVAMEKNDKSGATLKNTPLQMNSLLDDFTEEDSCDSGYCFV